MNIENLRLFLLVLCGVISVCLSQYNNKDIFCNEKLLSEVRRLMNKIPDPIQVNLQSCMKENEPDVRTKDVYVKCESGVKKIPPKFFNVIQYPMDFSSCGDQVMDTMELSDKEMKLLEWVKDKGFELFQKFAGIL